MKSRIFLLFASLLVGLSLIRAEPLVFEADLYKHKGTGNELCVLREVHIDRKDGRHTAKQHEDIANLKNPDGTPAYKIVEDTMGLQYQLTGFDWKRAPKEQYRTPHYITMHEDDEVWPAYGNSPAWGLGLLPNVRNVEYRLGRQNLINAAVKEFFTYNHEKLNDYYAGIRPHIAQLLAINDGPKDHFSLNEAQIEIEKAKNLLLDARVLDSISKNIHRPRTIVMLGDGHGKQIRPQIPLLGYELVRTVGAPVKDFDATNAKGELVGTIYEVKPLDIAKELSVSLKRG